MSTIQRRLLITATIVTAVLGGGAWTRSQLGIELDVDSIREFALGLGPAGPILFVLVVAGRSALALPSQVVLIAAGLCFGTGVGTLVGGAGLMLSGLVLFLGARYAGRAWVEARVSGRGRRLLEFASHRSGAVTLAVACGYPLMPLSPIQMAAGLTPMPIVNFVAAAFVGGAIRASMYAFFGDTLADFSAQSFVLSIALFGVAAAIPLAFPSGRTWLRQAFAEPRSDAIRPSGVIPRGGAISPSGVIPRSGAVPPEE